MRWRAKGGDLNIGGGGHAGKLVRGLKLLFLFQNYLKAAVQPQEQRYPGR